MSKLPKRQPPTVIHSQSASEDRFVAFHRDPVESVSRPVTTSESWACYNFESHARKCAYCHDPYEVHRNRERLCDAGHRLAQEIARFLYNKPDGRTYSTVEEDGEPVRVETPVGYSEVPSLLRAIDRSLRLKRKQRAFVSMDSKYYVAPRSPSIVRKRRHSGAGHYEDDDLDDAQDNAKIHRVIIRETKSHNSQNHLSHDYMSMNHGDNMSFDSLTDQRSFSNASYASLNGEDVRLPIDSLASQTEGGTAISIKGPGLDDIRLSDALDAPTLECVSDSTVLEGDNELASDASSDKDDVFSVASLTSFATSLSVGTGFTPIQIATATQTLLTIFCDDERLKPLYTAAIHGVIGPRKFANNFRRLLRIYSEDLKEEAQEYLENLAATLVRSQAGYIANAIVKRYQTEYPPELSKHGTTYRKLMDDNPAEDDENEEEEEEEAEMHFNIDESVFDELHNFTNFLIGGNAFQGLSRNVEQFVSAPVQAGMKKNGLSDASSFTTFEVDFDLDTEHTIPSSTAFADQLSNSGVESTENIIYSNIVQLLEEDDSLHRLHHHALASLGEAAFITHYGRILRTFCLSLIHGTRRGTLGEEEICLTIWWPRLCNRISQFLKMAGAESHKGKSSDAIKSRSALIQDRSRARSGLFLAPGYIYVPSDHKDDISAKSRELKLELGFLALPTCLHEIISTTPKKTLHISQKNSNSIVNSMIANIEDYTRVEWDWWPLSARMPDVALDQSRLTYKLGGVTLYSLLSVKQAQVIRDILPLLPAHPRRCSCCYLENPQMIQRINMRIAGVIFSFGYSKASQKYTPSRPRSLAIPSQSHPQDQPAIELKGRMDGNQRSPTGAQGQHSNATTSNMPSMSHRILFGIQGSKWSLDLEQIQISSLIEDSEFFRELKIRHKRHRSWAKRTLSPFRFRFCRFVKFEKFDTARILSQGEDLPDYPGVEQDYEYTPRPGTNPMISPKTFAVCLGVCNTDCKWPLVNPWHDCVRLPSRAHRLRCIPKKKSEFDMQSDDLGTVAWGLEADYALSFVFVAIYHLVPLIGAFAFWIYWLLKFPGDWQNAAVPVLTVLAMFAVVWVPFSKHINAT